MIAPGTKNLRRGRRATPHELGEPTDAVAYLSAAAVQRKDNLHTFIEWQSILHDVKCIYHAV
jgi:hypothetical protein